MQDKTSDSRSKGLVDNSNFLHRPTIESNVSDEVQWSLSHGQEYLSVQVSVYCPS